MIAFLIGLFIGLTVGGPVGYFATALMFIAGDKKNE